jgi:hypothetical protein
MIYPLTSTQLIASWSENSNTFHSSSHSTLMCLRSKPARCSILASRITLQIQELNPTANLHPTTICCPQIARESEDFEWCDLRIQSLFLLQHQFLDFWGIYFVFKLFASLVSPNVCYAFTGASGSGLYLLLAHEILIR